MESQPTSRPAEAGGPRRRAVVTGASTGIGAAFADQLARDQYDLVIIARGGDRLEALAKRLEARSAIHVEVRVADLTDSAALAGIEAELREATPDLLINNAGFGTVGHFAELDLGREIEEIQLNVIALVRLTRAVLPAMVARGHGAIINVSSMAGETATPYNATYGATKAYVTSFSEALHEELRGSGVRIQALLPGFTRTEFQERAGVRTDRIPDAAWMTADAVAEASLAALASGAALCVPGTGNRVLSAAQALVPRSLRRRMLGKAVKTSLG